MEQLNYSTLVRDRFERPVNAGRLLGDAVRGAAGEKSLGIRVEFDLRLRGGDSETRALKTVQAMMNNLSRATKNTSAPATVRQR